MSISSFGFSRTLFYRFDSLESIIGERLKSVLSNFTVPTVRIRKRSISETSVKSLGSGSKMILPRLPWSLWCLVHPLYFAVRWGVKVYSERMYTKLLFIELNLSWLWGFNPRSNRKLFKRVRISFLGIPLASARAQAKNSSDEKNSGRFKTNFHSLNVNSFQSHLRNKYLNRVVRLPDEMTYHSTTSPNFGEMELELTWNSWKALLWYVLKKTDLVALGDLKLRDRKSVV